MQRRTQTQALSSEVTVHRRPPRRRPSSFKEDIEDENVPIINDMHMRSLAGAAKVEGVVKFNSVERSHCDGSQIIHIVDPLSSHPNDSQNTRHLSLNGRGPLTKVFLHPS